MCAAVLAFLLLATTSPGPPRKSNATTDTRAADHEDKPNPTPPAIPVAPTIIYEQTESPQEQTRHDDGNTSRGWLTGLGVFFTGAYAVITYFQWRAMRRQSELMDGEIAVASAGAAAAKSAAETAERALHLAERAVVLVKKVSADELVALARETTFTVRIKNYGRTVASDVSFRIESNGAPLTAVGDAAIALGANGWHEHDFRPLFNMAQDAIEDIKQGRVPLSMRFEIQYKDVFSIVHHTTANVYYQPTLRKFVLHHTLCD